MKTILKLAAILAAFGATSTANAFVINYFLDVRTAGQWTLWANTDAPGGIASIVVDLGAGADAVATSVAPRSQFAGSNFAGFTLGNIFAAKQAFVGQNTSNLGSIKYGIGYQSIPNDTFAPAPFTMAPGSSAVLANLGFTGADAGKELNGWQKFYTGTGNLGTTVGEAFKSPQPAAFGTVFAAPGNPAVIGPGANLTATYSFPIPEPTTVALAALSIPAFIFAVRGRRHWRRRANE